MTDMNELERMVSTELQRAAGPVMPVDDRAVFESVAGHHRRRWAMPLRSFASYLAAGAIVALFGGLLLVGVMAQPPGDGIPAVPGGSASPEGTPSTERAEAPTRDGQATPDAVTSPLEEDVNKLNSPLATVLAVGVLASPVAAQAEVDPTQVTGTMTLPQTVVEGARAWSDGALRGHDRIVTSTLDASDPRLSGTYTVTFGYNSYDRDEMLVGIGNVVIENDGGRWVGTGSHLGGSEVGGTTTYLIHGEDGYDGLSGLVVIDEFGEPPTFGAAIFPGEFPVPTAE